MINRILTACALVLPAPALADAIDGDWCSGADARHLQIDGPAITTPTGRATTGDYSRHAFAYVVPEGEPGAGEAVTMQLLNDDEVRITEPGSAPAIWRRCDLNV